MTQQEATLMIEGSWHRVDAELCPGNGRKPTQRDRHELFCVLLFLPAGWDEELEVEIELQKIHFGKHEFLR